MNEVWEWLSGKKTAIGAVVLLASAVLTQVVVGIWGYTAEWVDPTIKTLDWVGGLVATGGLLHKGVKAKNGGDK